MQENNLIQGLNPAQANAVTAKPGNLLVLAGAGSGKTRVLVHRIAWLIENDVASPYSILAVTFTNKAAAEMRERLAGMLNQAARKIWVGTFHGLAHKLLRMHWQEAGLVQNFQVIDADDQLRIIKRVLRKLDFDEDQWEAPKVRSFINAKKDEGVTADKLGKGESLYEQVMFQVYRHYTEECNAAGVLDFADLLLRAYKLLVNNPEILEHYRSRFRHFLVDEFQDTNTIQYLWLQVLAVGADSVTVVGDDDQSIYGWRGARVENIQRYQKDYANTHVIRLEQNYRSTATILKAANSLINNNNDRMGKTLWTEGEAGELIKFYLGLNEDDEALYLVRNIKEQLRKGCLHNDIAILYRSNAQSRIIEEALVRANLPYTVYGGLRFFERAEIKDALAYIRLAINKDDDQSFDRIVNVPPRGIGKKSIDKIREYAENENLTFYDASIQICDGSLLPAKARNGLQTLIDMLCELKVLIDDNCSVTAAVSFAIDKSGLLEYFQGQKGERAHSRVENLEELVNATADFTFESDDDLAELNPLVAFLSYTSLDAGEGQKENSDTIQLMTLHSAKGLEFPVVFICGMEENLFPHQLAFDNVEEERRLCYVGITRAKQQLFLTSAKRRRLFGREEARRVSRFVSEIPAELINDTSRINEYDNSYRRSTISHDSVTSHPDSDFDYAGDTGLVLGQKVRHKKFGIGTIIDYEGMGDRARVSVRFENNGTKWLALTYANLEPV